MSQSLEPVRALTWRLRVLMAERDIRTATSLQAMLHDVGVHISSQQLVRVINGLPARLNTELLAGLLTVLQCGVDELIVVKASARSASSKVATLDEAARRGEPSPPSTPQYSELQPPAFRRTRDKE